MEIVYKKIKEIYPYSNNAKKHPKTQIEKIKKSISEFGFNVPLVIDNTNYIIAGHGRYEAAKELNLEKLPCIVKDNLTEAQIKAYRIADNKVGESGWVNENLILDFSNLKDLNYDLTLTGFDEDEIHRLFPQDDDDNIYTKKIETPVYTPGEKKPNLSELYNKDKYKELISDIETSNIDKTDKEFLKAAASRFIIFNYNKIADYYAHSNKKVQELMEQLALVIIDFNKAIEQGFISLTEDLAKEYLNQGDKDDD